MIGTLFQIIGIAAVVAMLPLVVASVLIGLLYPFAQAIEAGTDETRNAAQPEGRERGPKGAPK